MSRKVTRKRNKAEDPLLRDCTACGALAGRGCTTVVGKDHKLISRATRLVHAARLEGETDA